MLEVSTPLSHRLSLPLNTPPANKCFSTGDHLSACESGTWNKLTVHTNGSAGTIKLCSRNADEELSIYHITLDQSFCDYGNYKNLSTNNHLINEIFKWELVEQSDTESIFKFRYNRPGRYILNIKFDGLDIAGSPFLLIVTPGVPDPLSCKLLNAERTLITPKDSEMILNKIILQIRDSNNLLVPHGFHNVNVKTNNAVFVKQVIDNGDGTYCIIYSVLSSENPLLRILLNGKDVYGSPVVFNIINMEQYESSIKSLTFEDISKSIENMINSDKLKECEEAVVSKNLNSVLTEMIISMREHIYNIGTNKFNLLSVKNNIINKMHQKLINDYKDMYNNKTQALMDLVKSLENIDVNDANALSNRILTYKNISNELRKLHRREEAAKIEELIRLIYNDMNLNIIKNDLSAKESQIKTQEEVIKEKLEMVKTKLEEIKNRQFPTDDSLFRHDKAVSTKHDTPKLTKLINRRSLRASPTVEKSNVAMNEIDQTVSRYWVKSGIYDIHTTVINVLKSSPRLNRAISEVFNYYTPLTWINLTHLVIDLKINVNLRSNKQRMKWLFHKFCIEPENDVHGELVPDFLWVAFLRELGYLNLLYVIASDKTELLENQRPSRLVAFHHFCTYHFVPLYQKLFYTQEFQSKALILDKETTVDESEVRLMVTDLYKYLNKRLPSTVSQQLDLDALRVVFSFYTTAREAQEQRGTKLIAKKNIVENDNAIMTPHKFIKFACDFGIVPDHMRGESIRQLIGEEQITFEKFVKVVINIISSLVRQYTINQQKALEEINGPHYTSITIDNVNSQAQYFISLFHLNDLHSVRIALSRIVKLS